jgi:hypothetical protein
VGNLVHRADHAPRPSRLDDLHRTVELVLL